MSKFILLDMSAVRAGKDFESVEEALEAAQTSIANGKTRKLIVAEITHEVEMATNAVVRSVKPFAEYSSGYPKIDKESLVNVSLSDTDAVEMFDAGLFDVKPPFVPTEYQTTYAPPVGAWRSW